MARTLPDEPADDRLVVRCHLDDLLDARGMTLQDLATRTGITRANLSVLKNDRARAVRFTTLVALCEALECDVGDLLVVERPSTP